MFCLRHTYLVGKAQSANNVFSSSCTFLFICIFESSHRKKVICPNTEVTHRAQFPLTSKVLYSHEKSEPVNYRRKPSYS